MKKASRKPEAISLLLLIMFLICSTARGRILGGDYLRSSSIIIVYEQDQVSELQNQVTVLMKQVSDLSKDHDQVSDLKKQVSDLMMQVSNMDHDKVSDLKKDHDQVSDLKKDHDKVSDMKKDSDDVITFLYVLTTVILSIFLFAILIMLAQCIALRYGIDLFEDRRSNINVLRLQVGLYGLIRLLQKDLNRPGAEASRSHPDCCRFKKDPDYILSETIKALLRQLCFNNIIYAHSSVKQTTMSDWDSKFDQLSEYSNEECWKFNDGEILIDVDNKLKKPSSTKLRTSCTGNVGDEYIVVTILVAAKGEYKLPSVNNAEDLKQVLQKLGSIPSTMLKGVEVSWTPREENGVLSERKFQKDYPLLHLLA